MSTGKLINKQQEPNETEKEKNKQVEQGEAGYSTTHDEEPNSMRTPTTMRKKALSAQKMMVWMRMETTLVWNLPHSIVRDLPGIWKRSPGDRRMKSMKEMSTGPQSCIFFFLLFFFGMMMMMATQASYSYASRGR